jgi:carbamoyl-phosphate synthase large subunit
VNFVPKPSSDPVSVLVTSAGGSAMVEVVDALKHAGFRVVALNASPHAPAFALADACYVVPMGSDPAYDDALEAILERERPRFAVPLADEEIPRFHRVIERRFAGEITIVGPRMEFAGTMMDKWEAARALDAAGVPVPRTWLASHAGDAVYPAIVKPREGRGSRGLAYLDSADDLRTYLERADAPPDAYVVQERVMGPEYTVSVVVALGGPTLAVVPKEVIVKRGITQVGVTRENAAIDRACRAIQDRLRPDGPFNVQLIMDGQGVPRVIEVNPRFSTTVALTMAAGVPEMEAVIRHALGEPVGPLAFKPGLMMMRYWAARYVAEDEWAPGSADGR